MKKYKNLILYSTTLLSSIFNYSLYAQTPTPIDVHSSVWGGQFAPQGPEAMGMIMYGENTPDFYHGTVSVSIPLYTWSDNLFTVPVSLNYSSSGLKPALACSPEGLGWTLVVGGVITREVKGIPDESYHIAYSASQQFYGNPSGRESPVSDYIFLNPNDRHLPDSYEGYAIRGFANRYNGMSVTSTQKYIYTGGLGSEYICGSLCTGRNDILITLSKIVN